MIELNYAAIDGPLNEIKWALDGVQIMLMEVTTDLMEQDGHKTRLLNAAVLLLSNGQENVSTIMGQFNDPDGMIEDKKQLPEKEPQAPIDKKIEAPAAATPPEEALRGTTAHHLADLLKGDDPHRFFNALANEADLLISQINHITILTQEADGEGEAKNIVGFQDRICMNSQDIFEQIWREERKARGAKVHTA